MKTSRRRVVKPTKIYFSRTPEPESFPDDVGIYYFPFAERLCYYRVGRWIVFSYAKLRLTLAEWFE